MGKRTKWYAKEFVTRAVRLCDESDQPIAQVARDLGVECATLYGWMKKAGKTKRQKDAAADAVRIAVGESPDAMRAEIRRLERELEEANKKLEFAKKAAAFFAQHQK
jgi:transposase